MGGSVLYPHSSLSALSKPSLGKPFFPLKGIGDRPFVPSIRADGNRGKPQNSKSSDDRSSLLSNKEEILSLFKRIQSSISKNATTNSKKTNSKVAEDEAESMLEVLHQSWTRGKEKTQAKEGKKTVAPQKDLPKKVEERAECLSTTGLKSTGLPTMGLKSTRPPSSFTKRSPIPTASRPRVVNIEPKTETLPPRDDENSEQANKFEEMKVAELKEVAKANGIKGYSRLNKSELVRLLIRSLNTTSQ